MEKVCVGGLGRCWAEKYKPGKAAWELEWHAQESGSNLTKSMEIHELFLGWELTKSDFHFYGACPDNGQSAEYMGGGKNTS